MSRWVTTKWQNYASISQVVMLVSMCPWLPRDVAALFFFFFFSLQATISKSVCFECQLQVKGPRRTHTNMLLHDISASVPYESKVDCAIHGTLRLHGRSSLFISIVLLFGMFYNGRLCSINIQEYSFLSHMQAYKLLQLFFPLKTPCKISDSPLTEDMKRVLTFISK